MSSTPRPITIDEYSVAAFPKIMYFNQTELSIGTAFFWEANNSTFLITNRHNLTGMDNNTGKHLSVHAAEPNKINAICVSSASMGTKLPLVIDVLDSNGDPLWYIHPTHGKYVDVVALPINIPAEIKAYHINRLSQFPNMDSSIGSDVFILGYPFGITHGGLPIWKKGSIATEPELAGLVPELYYLIDTASRPGMSGSPVIRRASGAIPQMGGGVTVGPGRSTRFLGVYSGRLAPKDNLDASLGIAWPAEFVPQIIDGRIRDKIR